MTQPTTKTDPLRDPVLLAVGRCIEKWSWVENNLCYVLESLLGRKSDSHVGAAFHAVVNFNSKLDMVDAVARRHLSPRRFAQWNALSNRIDRKAKRRNEIAHFSIVINDRDRAFPARLFPYWSITKGVPLKWNQGLTAPQIKERAQSFSALSVAILQFAEKMPKRKARRAKRPPPRA